MASGPAPSPSRPSGRFRVAPNPWRVAEWLVLVVVVFDIIDLLSQLPRYTAISFPEWQHADRMFHLGREASVPAWYSSMLLYTAAIVTGLVAFIKRAQRDRFFRHWAGMAVLLLLMSADEAAMLHETVSEILNAHLVPIPTFGGWIPYGVAAVVIVSLAYLRFFLMLPRRTQVLMGISAAMFVAGAIGVESLQVPYEAGRPADYYWVVLDMIEESLEMLGVAGYLVAVLDYAQTACPRIELTLLPSSSEPRPAPDRGDGTEGAEAAEGDQHGGAEARRRNGGVEGPP